MTIFVTGFNSKDCRHIDIEIFSLEAKDGIDIEPEIEDQADSFSVSKILNFLKLTTGKSWYDHIFSGSIFQQNQWQLSLWLAVVENRMITKETLKMTTMTLKVIISSSRLNSEKFSFLSLNCHFRGKITSMMTRVNSWIFTDSHYIWILLVFWKW